MTSQHSGVPSGFSSLLTPALVLDESIMLRNAERLRAHLAPLKVALRTHVKTIKSLDCAKLLVRPGEGVTVSTLKEAEVFAAAGVRDILYAVGIAPQKLARMLALRKAGCNLTVILDSVEQAKAVCEASRASGDRIPALIEIDSDGHRAGLQPHSTAIAEIGRYFHENGAELRGVMTHAGASYSERGAEALAAFAERERLAAVTAAEALRAAGLPCPIVSVGSSPTAHFARDLTGVTEVRVGVFPFMDLVMAGIGVCSLEDIAVSVLTTVIGHQRQRGWALIDAGWMALSRDRGTASQVIDQGYGVVCDIEGRVLPDLIVTSATQEHGIISVRPGISASLPDLPVGTMLRILPNHACATAAQFAGYHVIQRDGGPLAYWDRFRGW